MLNILEINDNFCDCLIRIFIFLGHIMNIIKITVPIIIILLGSIDLIKAMVTQKDDEMKKSQKIFIKRLICGVVLFFVIAAVQFLIGLAGGDTNNRCFKCVADVNGEACDKENIPVCKEKQEIVETPEEPESTPETSKDEPEVPKSESDTSNPKENKVTREGWNCSNESQAPIEGCRVHFSDIVIGWNQNFFSVYNEEYPNHNDIIGQGHYNSFETFLPNSYLNSRTLDTLAIDENTKLIIFENQNFEGNYYEKDGPLLLFGSQNSQETINIWINHPGFSNYYNNIIYPYETSLDSLDDGTTNRSFVICCRN